VIIVVSLLLGYLYWHVSSDLQHGGFQNRLGSLFFMCTLLAFGSITSIDMCKQQREGGGEGGREGEGTKNRSAA